MDKEYKFYGRVCWVLFILIILCILGNIIMVYIFKDIQIAKFGAGLWAIMGLFHCVINVRLLFKIKKILSSKDTLSDSDIQKFKDEHKATVISFILYIISIPCVMAVLFHVKGATT